MPRHQRGNYKFFSRSIAIIGGLALAIALLRSDSSVVGWSGSLIVLVFYLVSANLVVAGLEGGGVLTISPVFLFAMLLTSGTMVTSFAVAIQIAYSNLFVRRLRDERVPFNIGQSILAVVVAGWVYSRLGGTPGPPPLNSLLSLGWWLPLQLFGAHLSYLLLNTILVATGISLRDGRSPWRYWRANYAPMILPSLGTPVAAFVLARLFLANEYLGVFVFFALMILNFIQMREKVSILRSRNHAVDTLLAVSGAAKPYSHEESAERAMLAQEMGRHMGLSQSRMQVLHDAVLLHNIGYVGVDPLMLKQKGTLNDDQAGAVRKHPLIGARILRRVPALQEVAWVVLCHHERPDGQGYPLRLNAGEAPAEAYIVAVVEGYSSLKYGREHQPPVGSEKAFETIASYAGTRYDRASVAALARALEFPVPPGLTPYLHAKPGRGDLNLKRHHLTAINSPSAGLSPETLRLFASFPDADSHASLFSIARGMDPARISPRDRLRGHVFVAALGMFTLSLLLFAQDPASLGRFHLVPSVLVWGSLLFVASLLVIRLPAGASFTAASSVALALALIHGPLAGALAGFIAGLISHALTTDSKGPVRTARKAPESRLAETRLAETRPANAWPQAGYPQDTWPSSTWPGAVPVPEAPPAPPVPKPPTSREILDVPSRLVSRRRAAAAAGTSTATVARPRPSAGDWWRRHISARTRMGLVYATAAATAGLFVRLGGGLGALAGAPREHWIMATAGALLAVIAYAVIETTSLSIWPPRGAADDGARSVTLEFNEWETVLLRQSPLAPPLPGPLNAAERWRDNYRGLMPEPLAYPAAGLLMALAYAAIGPWAAGVVFIYPVFWSHLRLEERLRLSDCRLRLLLSISQAIDERHHYTQGHSLRVGLWAGAIARELGYPETYARDMRLAGVLHDLGKASWTDAMLEKPRKLTPPENRLKEEHPVLSALVARASFPQVETAILQHHEDWDGTGYPRRVEGPRMDPGARILRAADTLDAISSGRPYKMKEGRKDPIEELLRCAYTDFDPAPVAALACIFGRIPNAARKRRRRPVPGLLAAFFTEIGDRLYPVARAALATLTGPACVWPHVVSRAAILAPRVGRDARARANALRFEHARRVAAVADLLAQGVGLTARERETLRGAAFAHTDLPPAGAPTDLAGHLADRRSGVGELYRLAAEPARAARRVSLGLDRAAARTVRCRHRRWDEASSVAASRGDAVPPTSRILAIACAFDRMLTPQPWRHALSPEAAAQTLHERGGTVFDPRLTEILISLVPELTPDMLPAAPPRGEVSTGLSPNVPPDTRNPNERLQQHSERLRSWAADVGVAPAHAELLAFRHEGCDGRGPLRTERGDVPPLIARFQVELLFLDLLRHAPRPLTPGIIRRALAAMEMFGGWAVSPEEISQFRRDVRLRGLPHTLAFAEWDRLTGGNELGGERARDEAILFAYYVAMETNAAFALEYSPGLLEERAAEVADRRLPLRPRAAVAGLLQATPEPSGTPRPG